MTTAMCTKCGSFRVGLFCPCPKCPRPTPEDGGQEFDLTDWNYSTERLSELSAVVKALRSTDAEISERRLALWRYVQRYYPEPDGEEMDTMAAERADRLLGLVDADRIHRRRVIWNTVTNCMAITWITYVLLRWYQHV